MDNDWILAKTPAGTEEIATRSRRVPTRLRTVLIIVDGRRSVRHLSESAAALGNIREALAELRVLGLVAPVEAIAHVAAMAEPASRASVSPAARPPSAVHSRPAPQPLRRRSLALARLYLLNAMEQSLRQADQPVRDHLRTATSRAELLMAFEMCRDIATELGVVHIDTIEAQFMGMLPEEN
jgi:hypothetical protein